MGTHNINDVYPSLTNDDLGLSDDIPECDYLSIEDTHDIGITSDDFICLQWNIRGLISKQSELSKFLFALNGKKKVDILMLNETWISKNNSNRVNIPGYSFEGVGRPSKKGGGVGFLISDEQRYSVVSDIKCTCDLIEYCAVSLTCKQGPLLLCSLYRPPNTNETKFINEFSTLVDSIKKAYPKHSIVLGMDHNMDLLKSAYHRNTLEFFERIFDKNLTPVITRPTRITKTSATLIDNIFICSSLCPKQRSCIVECDLSDHLPTMTVFENLNRKLRKPLIVTSRDLRKEKLSSIKSQLNCIDWSVLDDLPVNDSFNWFHKRLLDIINDVCPERETNIPAKRILREPWVTKGLQKCSDKQRSLYKNFLKIRTDHSELKYNNYRNLLKKIQRSCKSKYYKDKCLEYKSNTKKLWGIINDVKGKLSDKTCIIDCIKVDNIDVYNPSKIVNTFGHHYANVGKNYADAIPQSSNTMVDFINKIPRVGISISITISKLLEKIMYKRIYDFLDVNHALYDSQYGFRKKHSCEHAISELLSNIVKGFEKKEFTISIFLDLSKAFDTLSHSVLYDKLERYGIRGVVLDWFKSYLCDRSMQAKCNVGGPEPLLSKDYKVTYGTPQGSCLGPLLFLIFCNDLHYNLEFCACILFADDTTIYKSHKNLRYLEWMLNEDLKIVSDWFKCNKLTLNIGKTVSLLFSPTKKTVDKLKLYIGDELINQSTNTKFLGVWLDDQLNWRMQYLKLLPKLKRGEKLLQQCKNFLDAPTLKILYYAQFHSHLCYSISTWGSMMPQYLLCKLQKLQDQCVGIIRPCKTSLSDKRLSLNMLNVTELIELEHLKFAHKCLNNELPVILIKNSYVDHNVKSLHRQHNYNTRNKRLPNVVKCSDNRYKNCVFYKSFILYSRIPQELKECTNTLLFVKKCKKYLLKR